MDLAQDGADASAEQAVERAIAGELRLMEPRVRASRELAGELLDPGFVEVGKSGRRWDRASMLAELPTMDHSAPEDPEPVRVSDMTGSLVAPGVVQLTYATESDGVRALRSSLWRSNADGVWRMFYHQGTPTP